MSRTTTLELHELQQYEGSSKSSKGPQPFQRLSFAGSSNERKRSEDRLPSPVLSEPEESAATWNHPRSNIYRVACCFYCLLMMGLNDGAYGVSLVFEHKE